MSIQQACPTGVEAARRRARFNAIGGAALEAADRVMRQFQAEDERGYEEEQPVTGQLPSGRMYL